VIKYRLATIFDIPSISEMWRLMMDESDLESVDIIDDQEMERFAFQMTANLNNITHIIVIACEGESIKGFTHGNIYETLYSKPAIRLQSQSTYVYPDYRKQTVATELTDEFTRIAKTRSIYGMTEFMCKYDNRIIKKWERIGFKPDSVRMIRKET